MKRFGQLLIVALFATAAWTTSAKAAPQWFNDCDVTEAGMPALNKVVLRVSDLAPSPGFTNVFFLVDSAVANGMLAVALTSISLDKPCTCRVDLALSPPRLYNLYLKK